MVRSKGRKSTRPSIDLLSPLDTLCHALGSSCKLGVHFRPFLELVHAGFKALDLILLQIVQFVLLQETMLTLHKKGAVVAEVGRNSTILKLENLLDHTI